MVANDVAVLKKKFEDGVMDIYDDAMRRHVNRNNNILRQTLLNKAFRCGLGF